MECLLPSFKRCGTIFITWKKQGYIKAATVQLASLQKKKLTRVTLQPAGRYVRIVGLRRQPFFYFSWDQCGTVKVHRGRSALKDTLLWRGSKENQVSFSQPFFWPATDYCKAAWYRKVRPHVRQSLRWYSMICPRIFTNKQVNKVAKMYQKLYSGIPKRMKSQGIPRK